MDSPGLLIAKAVVILYLIMGPIILFIIYSFLDGLARKDPNRKKEYKKKKDPALWHDEEIENYFRDRYNT